MFEDYQICPYTGLRSFTEEESLYFKGREENIESATEQLQRNKFLMLTGASGDGKSSLVYAGIIPNARAGFLKSKYTQWCVADFRPERSPFKNLCTALAAQFEISNVQTVESELHHGFSALVDLYKNSKRFVDIDSVDWQQADEKGKAALKREAANLIILVDQFEEFFTNPENYHKGVPSRDSNLVLNLLLETARIALEENLPIYVVFTMRSDFIGQCAAFRGLPEYIGFSQFFVPRLNRTQLQQVIEEPAVLSGNKISRRLTERLIHDLTEGVDQLPILQHALNQIWHAADNGKEEMDLLHYAMVGGMSVNELPDEQVDKFNKWYEALTPEIKACYHEPNLQNVLDTHTNKLFEQAADYYKTKTGKSISDKDAKSIIKAAFICLTKIDQSRAVRNRMTLKEITNIFGRQEFGSKEIGAVLNIFREPGNTFIRPFITDDPESLILKEDDVLDITHESLIRNWAYLEEWAKEEFDNYSVSLDFEQQLNRWVDSGKSNGFLLSIGPLTYFENWYNKVNPNTYWIARYLPEEIEQRNKLNKALEVLNHSQEFLKRSARKHAVTRTVMRYGAKRIVAVLAIIAIVTLSSFAIRDYFRQQNEYILKTIKEETVKLASMPNLGLEFQIPLITEQLVLGNLSLNEIIDEITEPHQKIKIASGIATQLVTQGRNSPKKEILESLGLANELLEDLSEEGNIQDLSTGLKLLFNYSATAGLTFYYNQEPQFESYVKNNAARSARWSFKILKEQPNNFTDIQNLSLSLVNGINHKAFSDTDLVELLNILSPFENSNRTAWVVNNYARDKILSRGTQNYGIRHNGLFQDLAYLYAAIGNPDKAMQCMDSVLRYQQSFYQNDYTTYVENASNVAAVFYIYGKTQALTSFVNSYVERKETTALNFYHRLAARMFVSYNDIFVTSLYTGAQVISIMNLKFTNNEMLSYFYSRWRDEINKIRDADERNFNLAQSFKNEGNMLLYRKEMRGEAIIPADYDYYKKAFEHFNKVSENYLNQTVNVIGTAGADVITTPRKFLFAYPDYRVPFHPFEPRSIIQFFNSASFIQYMLDNDLFETVYKSDIDLSFFEYWLKDYHANMSSRDRFGRNTIPLELLENLAKKLEATQKSTSLDFNILYLHLGDYAFQNNEPNKGIEYLEKVQLSMLLNAFQYQNINFVNTYSFELTGNAIANLSLHNRMDLAYKFTQVFKKEVNRSSLYAFASQFVSLNQQSAQVARQLLDSAIIEMNKLGNTADFQPNRHNIAIALMYADPESNVDEAYRTVKNSFVKFQAFTRFSKAFAQNGNLYKAQQQIPYLISAADQSAFLKSIIEGYNNNNAIADEWKTFRKNQFIFTRRFLPYVNE